MHLSRSKHELVGKLCDEIAIKIVLRLVELKSIFFDQFLFIIIIIIYVCTVLCLDVECKNVNGCRSRRRKTLCKPRKRLSV